ncbi:hypothetical protein [Nocardioides plantarum]|uniref:Uncharacterized protein n=1 Tax=Nocardioides plantarum TaxID=29299 RepID=A0ABV5K7H3_9ACTN|nr:hypothetical protein [Nocardioides plantarum]
MTQLTDERRRVRDLAETLALEYGGALPPGQVLAVVFRSNHALGPDFDLTLAQRLGTCESIARRQLTARLAALQATPTCADRAVARHP